jgi:hypothetical protein
VKTLEALSPELSFYGNEPEYLVACIKDDLQPCMGINTLIQAFSLKIPAAG